MPSAPASRVPNDSNAWHRPGIDLHGLAPRRRSSYRDHHPIELVVARLPVHVESQQGSSKNRLAGRSPSSGEHLDALCEGRRDQPSGRASLRHRILTQTPRERSQRPWSKATSEAPTIAAVRIGPPAQASGALAAQGGSSLVGSPSMLGSNGRVPVATTTPRPRRTAPRAVTTTAQEPSRWMRAPWSGATASPHRAANEASSAATRGPETRSGRKAMLRTSWATRIPPPASPSGSSSKTSTPERRASTAAAIPAGPAPSTMRGRWRLIA